MDLKSGYPFWAVKNGLLRPFPQLRESAKCEVVVVGGGITGALISDELSRHGHDVIVLEQRDIGWGSTAASTALIQYEIDTHMVELAHRYGEANAVLAYRSCAEAIDTLRELAGEVRDVAFRRQQSLYYASRKRDVGALESEFAMRSAHGFEVTWLGREALASRFQIEADGAILSALAASLDPYRMAYRLFARVERRGAQVFDRTTVDTITPRPHGVEVRCGELTIRAKHVVLAAGYANEHWLKPRVAQNRSSYAYVTDPIDRGTLGVLSSTLVWETARPYLYLRTTSDDRLLVGGEDDSTDRPARRDRRVDSKAQTLAKRVSKLFPDLPVTPAFAWAGTFAETADGLPFFGAHAELGPRVLYAMAYGGNGITYSAIGAGLLRAKIERRSHPLEKFFSFARLG
jgi:glycine/D-amino acid oxidase-like deaminating enzyme